MSYEHGETYDYSTRIVSPQETLYQPTGEEQITIDIVDDTTLTHEDRRITLRPDTLALNGLLLLRHKGWVSRAEIMDTVGFDYAKKMLNSRLNKLSDSIEEITDFPAAIESYGHAQNAVVRLSPLLAFNDIRDTGDGFGVAYEWLDNQGLPRTMFVKDEYRCKALGNLFQQYTDHPQVALHMSYLQYGNMHKSSDEVRLSLDDIYACLAHIEYGLHAHLHDGNEEAKVMATCAYYSLLASTTPMIKGLAAAKSWIHTEDLIQEGITCTTETIMKLSGNEDLYQTAEKFYPVNASFINFKYANFITREVAAKRAMSANALYLEVLIQAVERRFVEEHGRFPSEVEVYIELNDPKITFKRVCNAMQRMEFGNIGTAHINDFEPIDRSSILSAAIDDQIERIYHEDLTSRVFSSKNLTNKEKVMLSLYYGIFVKNLQGAEVYKTKNNLVFTYPYDAATFDALAEKTVGNLSQTAEVLSYTHKGVNIIITEARAKAYAELEEMVGDDTNF